MPVRGVVAEMPASLEAAFSTDPYDRAAHTYGRSFRDLVRAFRRDYAHAPDLVVVDGRVGSALARDADHLAGWQ